MKLRLWILFCAYWSDALCSIAEEQLMKNIFANYNPNVRPVSNDGDTVEAKFGLALSQIVTLHEKKQMLVISAWTRQKWNNPYLKWDPNEYNGIKEISVDPSMVWKPDIVLYNNVDEDRRFGGNLDSLKTRVMINATGHAQWLAPVILKSQCDIDVTKFPFDTQKCPLKFGSWTYNKRLLNLVNESSGATLKNYSNNSEWYLLSAHANRGENKHQCCPELYVDITYTIIISRRSLFYVCNLIFPITVIRMLAMLSFLLPTESGERVSLAITLLLAQTVFMLVVADIIPATSDVIPLVGIFFSASMVEIVLMIVVLCYVMRLHHKCPSDPPMPPWIRRYILDWLSFAVCIREGRGPNGVWAFPSNHQHGGSAVSVAVDNQEGETAQMIGNRVKEPGNTFAGGSVCSSKFNNHHQTRSVAGEILFNQEDSIVDRLGGIDTEDQIISDWRVVAMTIDRCLLAVFATMFFITILASLSMSPGYVSLVATCEGVDIESPYRTLSFPHNFLL